MKSLAFEIATFAAIAALAFAVVFVVILAAGLPFGLDSSTAAVGAVLAIVFWLPAFANVHIAVASRKRRSRVCAMVRAFGLLLASAGAGSAFVLGGAWQVLLPFALGIGATIGTLFFDR